MIERRRTLQLMAGTLLGGFEPALAPEPRGNITIIGTGEVGSCLGHRWSALGYRVVYGSRTPNEAKVQALVAETGGALALDVAAAAAASEVIVLAVPWR